MALACNYASPPRTHLAGESPYAPGKMALAGNAAAAATAVAVPATTTTDEDVHERSAKPLIERQKDAARAILREAVLNNYFGVRRCASLNVKSIRIFDSDS